MNHQENGQPSHLSMHDDEISLVDLSKILVRRWKTMAAIFLAVVVVALIYALVMPRSYEYVSLYQVAEQAPMRDDGSDTTVESPSSLVAKANSLYLGPATWALLEAEQIESLPFKVTVSNPTDTQLLKVSSQSSPEHVPLIERMHDALLQRIVEGQQAKVSQRRDSLQRQLESARRSLEAAQSSQGSMAGELIASYTDQVATLENRLAQLQEGRITQTAVKSLEPTGTSRTLIMVLAIMLGAFLAVMSVFLLQFVSLVRASLREES